MLTGEVVASDFDEALHQVTILLHSQQQQHSHENLTAQRKVLVQGELGLKLDQADMNGSLPKGYSEMDLNCQKMFNQVSQNALFERDMIIIIAALYTCIYACAAYNKYLPQVSREAHMLPPRA